MRSQQEPQEGRPEPEPLREERRELAGRELLMPLRGADEERGVKGRLAARAIAAGHLGGARPVVVDYEGRPALLLFTSTDAVRRWRRSARFLAAPGTALLRLADRLGVSRVLVDVADAGRRILPAAGPGEPELIGAGPWRVRALAGPVDPRALFRLRRRLAAAPPVTASHLVESTAGGRDVLLLLFEVAGLSDQAAAALVEDLTPDVVPLLPAEPYVAVQVGVLTDPAFAEAVRAADDPVYVRG
jgi:hypothetical protein